MSAFESAIGAGVGDGSITVRFPAADGRWVDPVGDSAGIESIEWR